MEKLTSRRLLSNDRYAASRVRHRAQSGQGPVRIRAELRQQGVADEVIDREMAAADMDWERLAVEVRRRRFGSAPPRSMAERAKQARFLQYRGFSADQIRAALGGSDEPQASSDEPFAD
jgi:regulatory protein